MHKIWRRAADGQPILKKQKNKGGKHPYGYAKATTVAALTMGHKIQTKKQIQKGGGEVPIIGDSPTTAPSSEKKRNTEGRGRPPIAGGSSFHEIGEVDPPPNGRRKDGRQHACNICYKKNQ